MLDLLKDELEELVVERIVTGSDRVQREQDWEFDRSFYIHGGAGVVVT